MSAQQPDKATITTFDAPGEGTAAGQKSEVRSRNNGQRRAVRFLRLSPVFCLLSPVF
jgi:hypothetical protein